MRRPLHEVTKEQLPDRLTAHVYELNMLLRLAASYDIKVALDVVERDSFTEVLAVIASAKL